MGGVKCSNCDGIGRVIMGVSLSRLDPSTREFYKDEQSECKVCNGTGFVHAERRYYSHDPNVTVSNLKLLRQVHGDIISISIPKRHEEEVFVLFEDGSEYVIGSFLVGYKGTRPSNFKVFLDWAGFNITYDEIEAMCPPVTLVPPDEIQRTVMSTGDILDEALEIAYGQLKEYEKIKSEQQSPPSNKIIQIKAFNVALAKAQVEGISKIIDIKLKIAGRKGFLGIGKKPNIYEANIFIPAYVELVVVKNRRSFPKSFAPPPVLKSQPKKVSAHEPIGDPSEKVPCKKCGKLILKRMAALKDGYCIKCSGSVRNVFAQENYTPVTLSGESAPQRAEVEGEIKWTDGMKPGDRVKFCGVGHVGGVKIEHIGTVLEVRPDDYCVIQWDPGGVAEKIMGGPSFVELVHGGDLYKLKGT